MRVFLKLFLVLMLAASLTACGGDSSPAAPDHTGGNQDNDTGNDDGSADDGSDDEPSPKFTAASVAGGDQLKELRFEWTIDGEVDHFTIEVNQGGAGFVPVDVNLDGAVDADDQIAGTAGNVEILLALHLSDFDSTLYQMVAHDAAGEEIARSDDIGVLDVAVESLIGYFKASNAEQDNFGGGLALSADGNTLAVGAIEEDSAATGINGDEADNTSVDAGAVYVFTNDSGTWAQQAYIKASNTDSFDNFGGSIALSADGDTLAVSATGEDSAATGINGNEADNTSDGAGALYVFTRNDSGTWAQEAYIKASNTDSSDHLGASVALSADGNTLAVGSGGEASAATGVNGDELDDTSFYAGAVYVFTRNSGTWTQEAYIKASNTNASDFFGGSVALSTDGNTLAVTASSESSSATGVNGDQADDTFNSAGAVYVFARNSGTWVQQAYVKASNTDAGDLFGVSVALSADGNTLAVGASGEDSAATGVNGDEVDDTSDSSGAVYVFTRNSGTWAQEAYVKASNTDEADWFGDNVALSADGNTLAVGAYAEDSAATGVNGDEADNTFSFSGAVYVFTRNSGAWAQQSYVKASNPDANDNFGISIALSADSNTLAVGADIEDNTGAVYVY